MRQCQASEVQAANNAKPACEPRPTIEYLQDPNDLRRGSTLHPDQILVQKCSGSCLDNNMYQSCIASRKQSRTIQVRFFSLQEIINCILEKVIKHANYANVK